VIFCNTKTPEPTGSGTFLSLEPFLYPKRKIREGIFSYVEPLKLRGPNLFDIAQICRAKPTRFWGYGASFDTFLTLRLDRRYSSRFGKDKQCIGKVV
jgi:hypothetical protein